MSAVTLPRRRSELEMELQRACDQLGEIDEQLARARLSVMALKERQRIIGRECAVIRRMLALEKR